MVLFPPLCVLVAIFFLPLRSIGFGISKVRRKEAGWGAKTSKHPSDDDKTTPTGCASGGCHDAVATQEAEPCRRSFLGRASLAASSALLSLTTATAAGQSASAALGSIPEFTDTNAILQGLTVQVSDPSQQQAMVRFLEGAFDFQVLRQRIRGPVEEIWLGYGPEQLSVPSDFTLPVSSFAKYGGHASVCVAYDSNQKSVLYRTGDDLPADNNIAYLQVAVPGYRISEMVKNGGKVLDAYGFVSVISPAGLPVRGIVGIAPDPIMFVAVRCKDVKASRSFYEQLGFVEQEYPYSRPSKGAGQFEPAQPSKSVYMAPSRNCMGVLLLPTKNKKRVSPNPVLQSFNIVYNPSEGSEGGEVSSTVVDPSGIPIRFQPVGQFEAEEQKTR